MDAPPEKTVETTIRIDWSDLDLYEHVNNVSIIRFLQSARVKLWELSGLYDSYRSESKGAILVNTNCSFRHELKYPGHIRIKSHISKVGNSSFDITHHGYDDHGNLCVHSVDTVVCYDFIAKKTFPVPESLKVLMTDLSS